MTFLVGTLTVFFNVAYRAYLPSLVKREELVEANSKLEFSESSAYVAGPGLAGLIIRWLSATMALLFDALSFVFSAILLSWIRQQEEPPEVTERLPMMTEVRQGVSVVLGNRLLRAAVACSTTISFFHEIIFTLYILYAVRELDLNAATIGIIFAISNGATILAAVLASRLVRRFGFGRVVMVAALFMGLGNVPLLLATPSQAFWLILLNQLILGFALMIYNINIVSLRQAMTPRSLQGRMNATFQFMMWGIIPFAALIAGGAGTLLGLRTTIALATIGGSLAFLWLFFSPVRKLWEIPNLDKPEPKIFLSADYTDFADNNE